MAEGWDLSLAFPGLLVAQGMRPCLRLLLLFRLRRFQLPRRPRFSLTLHLRSGGFSYRLSWPLYRYPDLNISALFITGLADNLSRVVSEVCQVLFLLLPPANETGECPAAWIVIKNPHLQRPLSRGFMRSVALRVMIRHGSRSFRIATTASWAQSVLLRASGHMPDITPGLPANTALTGDAVPARTAVARR